MKVAHAPAALSPKRLIRASAFAGRDPPPRPWHVEPLIPGRTVTLLTGNGGDGKTELALQLAAATVLGRPWLGMTPRPGPALYLSSEDDEDELHRRLDATRTLYEADMPDLHDLHLWALADDETVLAVANRDAGAIVATPLWHELEAHAEAIRPALIVLDSLADVFGGDEIIRAQARRFIAMLRHLAIRAEASVLVLAHPSLSGMSSGSGTSGSTAWSNSVRSRLYLSRPSAEGMSQDPDLRTLSLKKANYAQSGVDLTIRRRLGGYVVEHDGAQSLDVVAAQGRIDRLFLDLLAAYEAQGRTVSDRRGHNYAPAIFAADPLAKGVRKEGLAAAMNRLFAANAIAVEVVGPASRQVRKLVRRGE